MLLKRVGPEEEGRTWADTSKTEVLNEAAAVFGCLFISLGPLVPNLSHRWGGVAWWESTMSLTRPPGLHRAHSRLASTFYPQFFSVSGSI